MTVKEPNNLGRRVREIRENAGISRKALAEGISVSISTIRDIEMGVKIPRTDTLVLICNYFHISADYILQDSLEVGYQARIGSYMKQLEECVPEEREKKLSLIQAVMNMNMQ